MGLEKDEEALYDRQIRLWGLAAQERIRQGTVIIAGVFTGVAQELVKNLVLKGVGKIILLWWELNLPKDYDNSSLLFPTSGATNKDLAEAIVAQAGPMNPTVEILNQHLETFNDDCDDDDDWAKKGNALILINESNLKRAIGLNEKCRRKGISFEWVLTSGFSSLLINDFGSHHQYTVEDKKNSNGGQIVSETKTFQLDFLSLKELWERHKSMASSVGGGNLERNNRSSGLPLKYSLQFEKYQVDIEEGGNFQMGPAVELSPVNAIIGAVAAQETIKAITGRDLPLKNVLLFEGQTLKSTILCIE